MTAYEKFTFLRGWDLFKTAVSVLLKIAFIYTTGLTSVLIVLIDIGFNILYQLLIIFYTKFRIKIRFRFKGMRMNMLREVFSYSFFIFIGLLVDTLFWSSDVWILGWINDNQQVAVYSLGTQFSDYFIRIATMICGMLMARIMTMVVNKASGKMLTDAMIKFGRMQMLILGLILVGFVICGQHFINQWAPGRFYHDRIFYIGLMFLIPLMIPEIQILGLTIIQAKGMHKFRALSYLAIAVVKVLVSIPLARAYGAIGAAAATCGSILIGHVLIMNLYYKYKVGLEIGRFFKEVFYGLLPSMLAATALCCITFLLPVDGLPFLFIRMFIVTVIYCAVQWLFGMNKSEKNMTAAPLRRLLKIASK